MESVAITEPSGGHFQHFHIIMAADAAEPSGANCLHYKSHFQILNVQSKERVAITELSGGRDQHFRSTDI
jgi:hypothetical protein